MPTNLTINYANLSCLKCFDCHCYCKCMSVNGSPGLSIYVFVCLFGFSCFLCLCVPFFLFTLKVLCFPSLYYSSVLFFFLFIITYTHTHGKLIH